MEGKERAQVLRNRYAAMGEGFCGTRGSAAWRAIERHSHIEIAGCGNALHRSALHPVASCTGAKLGRRRGGRLPVRRELTFGTQQ